MAHIRSCLLKQHSVNQESLKPLKSLMPPKIMFVFRLVAMSMKDIYQLFDSPPGDKSKRYRMRKCDDAFISFQMHQKNTITFAIL